MATENAKRTRAKKAEERAEKAKQDDVDSKKNTIEVKKTYWTTLDKVLSQELQDKGFRVVRIKSLPEGTLHAFNKTPDLMKEVGDASEK